MYFALRRNLFQAANVLQVRTLQYQGQNKSVADIRSALEVNELKRSQFMEKYFWYLFPPESVPRRMRRYVQTWLLLFPLAGLSHVGIFVACIITGVWPLVWLNVVSIPFYLVCFLLLRRAHYQLALILMLFEITIHAWVGQYCLGVQSGFAGYIIAFLLITILQPFWSLKATLGICFIGMASVGGLILLTYEHVPLFDLTAPSDMIVATIVWILWSLVIIGMVVPFSVEVRHSEAVLEEAWNESETLLLNILPAHLAERLKQTGDTLVDEHQHVAVLFVDIAGFTSFTDKMKPEAVVDLLDAVFAEFDEVAELLGAEKIKTIGDAWMAVAGDSDCDETIALLALAIKDRIELFQNPVSGNPLKVRIGINSGRVVAGVIGRRKFAYDVWGDTVNVAARMEETGLPGRIQLPANMVERLKPRFKTTSRGSIEVKGKGLMQTAWLEQELPDG